MTIARRAWPSPSDVRSVESFSGSIGKTSAAVYTDVVLVRAWASIAEPSFTVVSTSATATRIFTTPSVIGCATVSWSRSRESSLSIEAQRRPRRSRIDGPASAAAFALASVSAKAAGEKSGSRPCSTIARRAMPWSVLRFGTVGRIIYFLAGVNTQRRGRRRPRSPAPAPIARVWRDRGCPGTGQTSCAGCRPAAGRRASRGAMPGAPASLGLDVLLAIDVEQRARRARGRQVLAQDIAELTHPVHKGIELQKSWVRPGGIRRRPPRKNETDPVDLPRLRRGCRERRKNKADSENDREPDQPHEHLGEGRLPGSLAERQDAHQDSAARACHSRRDRR